MVGFSPHFRRWLRHPRIAFDTSFLIPVLEDVKEGEQSATRILRTLERKEIFLVTSTVTLLEILVHPYRRGESDRVALYYSYLTRYPLVRLEPVTAEIAARAAQVRAVYGFKTPDAIQLATALLGGATLFLTGDRAFRKQQEIEVGVL